MDCVTFNFPVLAQLLSTPHTAHCTPLLAFPIKSCGKSQLKVKHFQMSWMDEQDNGQMDKWMEGEMDV